MKEKKNKVNVYSKDFKPTKAKQKELKNWLKDKAVFDKLVRETGKKIIGEIKAREILLLCALGGLVKNANYSSFNVLVHGESSSGKDYVVSNVMGLFPSPQVHKRTRLSPTVLNYWKPYEKSLDKDFNESWNGHILYLPDISDVMLNSEALKLMCSEGSYITITEKGEAVDIEIKGKPVIITTTANATPTNEILNRFVVAKLDESEEQTKAIIKKTALDAVKGGSDEYVNEATRTIAQLKQFKVKIPYAEKITKHFPIKLIRERRNFDRFLDLIKVVCALYQEQRKEVETDTLQATSQDYDIAKEVFMNCYAGISSIPLNKRNKEIVDILEKEKEPLMATEIHQTLKTHIDLSNLRPHLNSLVLLKIIDEVLGKDYLNREVKKYTLSEEMRDLKPIKLPNFNEL